VHPLPEGLDRAAKVLLFPAMFAYPPNVRAALYLIEEVFPRLVTKVPDCRLLLVGSMPTLSMMQAAQKDSRILVTGTVPDIRPYFAGASIMVAPLFEGAGTRFKILEAFAATTPVVTTAQGAEGLRAKHGTHLLIAENAVQFVNAVTRLWADECLADRLAANALALAERYYSWNAASRRIDKAVRKLFRPADG
jgi:glycosyltransferase involved in cell wall biosynthesis